jgi:multidrug transporter EmrE-like cation transporter
VSLLHLAVDSPEVARSVMYPVFFAVGALLLLAVLVFILQRYSEHLKFYTLFLLFSVRKLRFFSKGFAQANIFFDIFKIFFANT